MSRTSVTDALASQVAAVVNRLQGGALPDSGARGTAAAAASLAALRHSDPGNPAASPDAWAVTMPGCPDVLLTDRAVPAASERALHAAVCLYAVHQQSLREPMHRRGQSLGAATRALCRAREGEVTADSSAVRRLHLVGSAVTHEQRVHQLRSLVTLLRAERVPLDYVRLALDLYRLQLESAADGVRLRWARDLHRQPAADTPSPESPPTTVPDTPSS